MFKFDTFILKYSKMKSKEPEINDKLTNLIILVN